jgi:gamma-glutamylcyclotransferase (GGCT)/AIG2-like uncharacterized protein YtfP
MSDYLFAYGTLRPGRAPEEIAAAVEKLRPVGEGFVHGTLCNLGEYPGAVLDPSTEQRISGTVFELPDDADILHQLDEYEGYDADAPKRSVFVRTRHTAVLETGEAVSCWMYAYNRTESGDER